MKMSTEERWLAEIISSQKRTLILSFIFLVLTVASVPAGLFLFQYEPSIFEPFEDPGNPPPVVVPDYSGLASIVIGVGLLLLVGGIYFWQFYTPTGVRNQLQNLQELFSATLKTKRREHQLHLPDGPIVTVKYAPYRFSTQQFCGFKLQFSPSDPWTDAMSQEALRGGFSMTPTNVLCTNCSLEEFFPRTLLLYTTIRRIRQLQKQEAQT